MEPVLPQPTVLLFHFSVIVDGTWLIVFPLDFIYDYISGK